MVGCLFWSFRRHTKSRRTVGQVLGSTLAWTLAEFALICKVKKLITHLKQLQAKRSNGKNLAHLICHHVRRVLKKHSVLSLI